MGGEPGVRGLRPPGFRPRRTRGSGGRLQVHGVQGGPGGVYKCTAYKGVRRLAPWFSRLG